MGANTLRLSILGVNVCLGWSRSMGAAQAAGPSGPRREQGLPHSRNPCGKGNEGKGLKDYSASACVPP